jgi:simple sugar transport system permease protein
MASTATKTRSFRWTVVYEFFVPLTAVVLSFIVGASFILVIGADPLLVYSTLFRETLGNLYGIGQVLFKATPLIFTGLSVAICFRAGLFNIGAEGQLQVGTFLAALAGFTFADLPAGLHIPLCLIAGMAGGALWGFIPGFLKAKLGSHEVINTIMMNFVAQALVGYMVSSVFSVPGTMHTPEIAESARIPRLSALTQDFQGSPVNFSVFLALFACLLMYVFLWKTRSGYELRAVGLSPSAAEYGGINVKRMYVVSMTMGGALSGIVGSNFVLGYKYYYEMGFSSGLGFIGIAVALLGKNHPLGIFFAAILFGVLEYGGLVVNTMVPKELVNILQAVIIIFVVISSKVFRNMVLSVLKKESKANA